MKRSRLNPISGRRRREMRELAASVKVIRERSGGWCEARMVIFYNQGVSMPLRGEEPHHLRLRSQGGGHEPGNLIWVSSEAHKWIHRWPTAAARLGLLITRKEIA